MTIFILALLSAAFYRVGGAGREEIPFANSQYRDIGCPVVILIALISIGFVWYISLVCSLLVLGFIRTYHDWTGKDNFFLHGLFLGLSMLPLAWYGVALLNIVAYTSIVAFSVGVLNTFCTRNAVKYSVWIEEIFRGWIIVISLLVLTK